MPVDPHLLLAFVLTTIVAMVTPGPDMLFILGCGMRGGPKAGLLATAGVATSEAIHVTVVKIAGAAYLIHLGIQAIRNRKPLIERTGDRAYLSGLLTNLLNPKMVTFTIAFLPQFIDPGRGHVWLQFAVLGAIMIVFEFLVDGAVGVLAGRVGGWVRRKKNQRRIEVATGGIFIGLGVRLALD
jgi:threonine/homoserine/homoserine lactone efflux protein